MDCTNSVDHLTQVKSAEHDALTPAHAPAELLFIVFLLVFFHQSINSNSCFIVIWGFFFYCTQLHSMCPQLATMLSITLDLILMRQTMPGSCKVCHCAINLWRKEHESITSKQLLAIFSGKSNTHLQGRVCGKLWHDKKFLYSRVHLEKRLECSYQIFTLSVLTSIFCVNSLWCSAGRGVAICGVVFIER